MITPFIGVTAKETSADDMICCENDNFQMKWYNYFCFDLTSKDTQEEDWYCTACKQSDT